MQAVQKIKAALRQLSFVALPRRQAALIFPSDGGGGERGRVKRGEDGGQECGALRRREK